MEIAVFLGADGASASLSEPGKITIFRQMQGSWEADREKEFSIREARDMRELREIVGEILRFLADCRIFVAKTATGIPYFELEKAGRSVWEISGRPGEFLDRVWEDEEREKSAGPPTATVEIPTPAEITPGQFFFSIKEIQEKNSGVSSKQILQQFIRQCGFRSLMIVCSHIPPWIEAEVAMDGLIMETEQLAKNEFKVRIVKK
ncbi:MAG TPA: Fe-only nitrogenase accessory AnfO family protein [Methanocella sp.]|nr:Fe-only nitrogenase accessory AnfO family protein [Methanocella sp.]